MDTMERPDAPKYRESPSRPPSELISAAGRPVLTEKKSAEYLGQWDIKWSDGVLNYSIRNVYIDLYRTTSTPNNTIASFVTLSFEIYEAWHPKNSARKAFVAIFDRNGNILVEVELGSFQSTCKTWRHEFLQAEVDPRYFDPCETLSDAYGGASTVIPCP